MLTNTGAQPELGTITSLYYRVDQIWWAFSDITVKHKRSRCSVLHSSLYIWLYTCWWQFEPKRSNWAHETCSCCDLSWRQADEEAAPCWASNDFRLKQSYFQPSQTCSYFHSVHSSLTAQKGWCGRLSTRSAEFSLCGKHVCFVFMWSMRVLIRCVCVWLKPQVCTAETVSVLRLIKVTETTELLSV